MTGLMERVRMIFDTDERIRRAVKIRAARTGATPSDVINEAIEKHLSDEIEEAEESIRKHGPKPKKRPD